MMVDNQARVCLRLTENDFEKLQQRAKHESRLVSEIARDALRGYLGDGTEEHQSEEESEEKNEEQSPPLKKNMGKETKEKEPK